VLTVVEDDNTPYGAQFGRHCVQSAAVNRLGKTKRGRNGPGYGLAIGPHRQHRQVGEHSPCRSSEAQGQACLAHTSRPDQADQRVVGHGRSNGS
jgi:hypothetical protein